MCRVRIAGRGKPGDPAAAGVSALGYAVFVARTCPNWTMAAQPVLARRGILPRADIGSGAWALDGRLHDAFYAGLSAAERDRRGNPGFCRRPADSDAALRRRLARILLPTR